MASSIWWVILTITWFLAAVPKWGSEAIEKKALLFHASVWGNPGTLTSILLEMNKIEGDGKKKIIKIKSIVYVLSYKLVRIIVVPSYSVYM